MLERRDRSQVGHRVQVGQGVNHQDSHAAIQHAQGVAGLVDEQQRAQAKHQPRHRHRQQRGCVQQGAAQHVGAGFFHHIGAHKNQRCAHAGDPKREAERVPEVFPADALHVKHIVLERQAQVIGPKLHQRRQLGHAQNCQNEEGDQQAIAKHKAINQGPGLRHQGHCARA